MVQRSKGLFRPTAYCSHLGYAATLTRFVISLLAFFMVSGNDAWRIRETIVRLAESKTNFAHIQWDGPPAQLEMRFQNALLPLGLSTD